MRKAVNTLEKRAKTRKKKTLMSTMFRTTTILYISHGLRTVQMVTIMYSKYENYRMEHILNVDSEPKNK